MDFPRLENGIIDPSFDDYYIHCRNNIRIRHGYGNVLSCYIPSKGRGLNILRQIFNDKIEPFDTDKHPIELIEESLKNKDILIDIDVLSEEVYFTFKTDMLDYIADLVGVTKNGASIQPLSPKNLPKSKYIIPEDDLNEYKKVTEHFPKVTRTIQGKEMEIVDGLFLNRVISSFDEVIIKNKGKGFDVKTERKKRCLKGKEYIHSIGMWDEFLDYLKNLKI